MQVVLLGGVGALLALSLVGCPYGPRELDRYPASETSPYLLPYATGTRSLCVQGNNGVVSHNGGGEFAYDFLMPTGTSIHAAREGVVIAVRDDSDRIASGDAKDNNYVRVRHSDGTVGSYLHLEEGGALVKVGQTVRQGEVLARSGWTGRAALPHLHFHVRSRGRQIPITFRDVKGDRGVPRTLKRYRAGG
jgi:murein DD-endopeptidase MepM/ murein hydrolase activator NlpD